MIDLNFVLPSFPHDLPSKITSELLTLEQLNAANLALSRIHECEDLTCLGGLAGTGKTTVLSEFIRHFDPVSYALCAFTGKAVSVLQRKLDAADVCTTRIIERFGKEKEESTVSTIHSLIYLRRETVTCKRSGRAHTITYGRGMPAIGEEFPSGGFCQPCLDAGEQAYCVTETDVEWIRRQKLWEGLQVIIIDEASMVSREMFDHLSRYGVPILAVGDHGQLPPVSSRRDSFNLMAEAGLHAKLETIHRQAAGSPITMLAHKIRNEGSMSVTVGNYSTASSRVLKVSQHRMPKLDWKSAMDPENRMVVLCGRNATRVRINRQTREQLGYSELPQKGDRVVCLRNCRQAFNGQQGTIVEVRSISSTSTDTGSQVLTFNVALDDMPEEILTGLRAPISQFNRPTTLTQDELRQMRVGGVTIWDYAYCMTVHKFQGSEVPRVVVMEERLPGSQKDHDRWLYTAVTRSSRDLLIIS